MLVSSSPPQWEQQLLLTGSRTPPPPPPLRVRRGGAGLDPKEMWRCWTQSEEVKNGPAPDRKFLSEEYGSLCAKILVAFC